MPNFLDCPREIRDMIFIQYYIDILQDKPWRRIRKRGEKLFSLKHSIALEAIEAAIVLVIDDTILTTKAEIVPVRSSRDAWSRLLKPFRRQRRRYIDEFYTLSSLNRQLDALELRLQNQERIAARLRRRAERPANNEL